MLLITFVKLSSLPSRTENSLVYTYIIPASHYDYYLHSFVSK